MSVPETEILNNIVRRVFRIDDVTSMDPLKGNLVRYRGQLLKEDSVAAFDELTEALSQYSLTPLFRVEEERQVIYIAPKQPEPAPEKISTNIILFVLTVFSVMMAGTAISSGQLTEPIPTDVRGQLLSLLLGLPFAVSLLSILLAHEFGHYLMSRYHKTPASLPYFIPLPPPLGLLGTMGAAIIMRGTPKNKRVLFDIGIAGPLAGLVVAIPVLLYGLRLSTLGTITPAPGVFMEGNSLMYLLAKYIVFGQLLPAPAEPQSILYWIQYFFTGRPLPFGGTDVFIHSVAFAGWGGLLVTGLNLIPAGTLDGGHVIYGLFGEKARKAFPYIIGVLMVMGMFWNGWWLWAALLFWLGRVHAQPLDQITELDLPRKALAVLMLIIFVLVFMPVPFMLLTP